VVGYTRIMQDLSAKETEVHGDDIGRLKN